MDCREQAAELRPLLEKTDSITLQIEQLPVGDFWIGDVVIERKSCGDLFHSLVDGRLFRQLDALRRGPGRPLLLVEGFVPQSVVQFAPNAIRGLVANISVRYRIPIIWSESQQDSARWILTIAKQEGGRSTVKHSIRPSALKPSRVRDQQLFLLAGLPGSGELGPPNFWNTSELLERFRWPASTIYAKSPGLDSFKPQV